MSNMRISVVKGDPGYLPSWAERSSVRVYLDGKEVRRVITADEELGFVLRHADDVGDKPIDADLCTIQEKISPPEELHGVVRIDLSRLAELKAYWKSAIGNTQS